MQGWYLGRLCEEYSVTPLHMLQELRDDPEQWAVQIAEMRAYARAKARVDAATKDDQVDHADPFVRRVVVTQAALLREG